MQRKLFCILILCILALIFTTGCSILQKFVFGDTDNDELRPASSLVMDEEEASKLKDKRPIRLYFANEDNTKLRAEIRYIDASDTGGNTESLATIVVKELIKGPGKGTGLKSTIPEGTKLLSNVIIKGNTATVNFSKEFVEKHSGEKDAEKLTIYSIVNSLTELREIQKVEFKIEGKSKTQFKGGFKFDAPFPRSTSIISKEPPVRGEIETDEESLIEDKNKESDGEDLRDKENGQKDEDKTNETFGDADEEEILE